MKNLIAIGAMILVISCVRIEPSMANSEPVDHSSWTSLLKKHVDAEGNVSYKGFTRDSVLLNRYIDLLATTVPNKESWTEKEQLAYYINLYNAATIQLVIRHYPLESIKDIGSKIQIPFINTPWQIKFIQLGDEVFNLDNVEHNIIRKVFDEPRIHFALVCAAKSCPRLRNEAYEADKLEAQLADQTRTFLATKGKNTISVNELKISKIFQWFSGDFTKTGTVQEFIDKYTDVKVNPKAKISYQDYNWELNDM